MWNDVIIGSLAAARTEELLCQAEQRRLVRQARHARRRAAKASRHRAHPTTRTGAATASAAQGC